MGQMGYTVVIPTKYDDIFRPLLDSIHRFIHRGRMPRIIVVADGHERNYGFDLVRYTEPEFSFPKAANLGLRAAGDDDVILLNDDAVLLDREFFDRLDWLAWEIPRLGVLSPLIVGCAGTPQQRWHERGQWWKPGETIKFVSETHLCFPCVWISRAMLNSIGLFDESIQGYGGDDVDLCRRAREAGWHTAITSRLKIQHGDGGTELADGRGKTWSLSFSRRYP